MKELRDNVKRQVSLDDVAAGHNKRKLIERAVFTELTRMVDAGQKYETSCTTKDLLSSFVISLDFK